MSTSPSRLSRPKTVEINRRALTKLECRSWLGDRHEGRLSHQTGRGTRAVVVNYSVTDNQLLFRLPEYNEICQYAEGRQVTMSVSAIDTNQTFTEVVVTGVGYLDENQAEVAVDIDPAERWPAGVSTHLMCLDLADVKGTIDCVHGTNRDRSRRFALTPVSSTESVSS
jgi:hypothetical protein